MGPTQSDALRQCGESLAQEPIIVRTAPRARTPPPQIIRTRLLDWIQQNTPLGPNIPPDLYDEPENDMKYSALIARFRHFVCKAKLSKVYGQRASEDVIEDTSCVFSEVQELRRQYLGRTWDQTVDFVKRLREERRQREGKGVEEASGGLGMSGGGSSSGVTSVSGSDGGVGVTVEDVVVKVVDPTSSTTSPENPTVPIGVSGAVSEGRPTLDRGRRRASDGGESSEEEGEEELDFPSVKEMMDDVGREDVTARLAIKLVLTEIAHSWKDRAIRSIVSPILYNLSRAPPMGMIHTALMIGPWMIEWNASSLCLPRKVVGKNPFLAIDLKPICGEENIDAALQKLAKVIVFWNTRMVYKSCPRNAEERSYMGNCQEFVIDCLLELGRTLPRSGPFGHFLTKLVKIGRVSLTYVPSERALARPEVQEFFRENSVPITFKSHADLDNFVAGMEERLGGMAQFQLPKDYALLKAFDRAYWMKFIRYSDLGFAEDSEQIVMNRPRGTATDALECDCPFQHPETESHSMVFSMPLDLDQ